jgi:hypothetical protein
MGPRRIAPWRGHFAASPLTSRHVARIPLLRIAQSATSAPRGRVVKGGGQAVSPQGIEPLPLCRNGNRFEEIDVQNDASDEGWEVGVTTNNIAYLKRQVMRATELSFAPAEDFNRCRVASYVMCRGAGWPAA